MLCFTPVISLLLALAITSFAKPLAVTPRDAISPPITLPNAQTVWRTGETQTVTWDLSGLNGAQPSNPLASILLGTFIDGEEHLMVDSPLVSGFPILGGNVSLVVPAVPTGSNYIVCLLGSSGDISAAFTIVGTDASSTVSPTTNVDILSTPTNTLPPHQTTDRSTTTVSLPPSVIKTDPGTMSSTSTPLPPPTTSSSSVSSTPTTGTSAGVTSSSDSSSPSASESSGTLPSGPAASVTAAAASSSDTSASGLPTGAGTGGNGAKSLGVSYLQLIAILGASAFCVLL